MKAAIHYAFDSFLRKFHEGYRLFLSSRQSVGALKP